MPPTLEVACTDESCPLDMVELHLTYEMVGDLSVEQFRCPYCGGRDGLERLEYTYDDRE